MFTKRSFWFVLITVILLVGIIASPALAGKAATNLAASFNSGTWYYDGVEWPGKISNSTAEALVYDGDVLYASFSSGTWKYDGGWTRLSTTTARALAMADVTGDKNLNLVASFPSGTWYWDGGWAGRVSNSTATALVGDGEVLYASFASGTWKWDDGWVSPRLSPSRATALAMTDVNEDGNLNLVASFASGTWYWDGSWAGRISGSTATALQGLPDGWMVASFASGTWLYDIWAAKWERLSTSTARALAMPGDSPEVPAYITVDQTVPANGATNVAVNTAIEVTFEQNINILDAGEISVGTNGSAVSFIASVVSDKVLRLVPDSVLAYNTGYDVEVGVDAVGWADDNSVKLENAYAFSFTTAEDPDQSGFDLEYKNYSPNDRFTAGVHFHYDITNAKDADGNLLNGDYNLTIVSDNTDDWDNGVIINERPRGFTDGAFRGYFTIEGVGIRNLTFTIETIEGGSTGTINKSVIEAVNLVEPEGPILYLTNKDFTSGEGPGIGIGTIRINSSTSNTWFYDDYDLGWLAWNGEFATDEVVTLEAVPVAGYVFKEWRNITAGEPGTLHSTDIVTTVTMSDYTRLMAVFEEDTSAAGILSDYDWKTVQTVHEEF